MKTENKLQNIKKKTKKIIQLCVKRKEYSKKPIEHWNKNIKKIYIYNFFYAKSVKFIINNMNNQRNNKQENIQKNFKNFIFFLSIICV